MSRERHKRCLGCGYILDGLPENRCPECGRPFDPGDPSTYLTSRPSGRGYLVAAIASLGMLTLPLLALALATRTDWYIASRASRLLDFVLVLTWSCGVVLAGVVCVHSIRLLRRPAHLVERRLSLVGAIALVLLWVCVIVGLILL